MSQPLITQAETAKESPPMAAQTVDDSSTPQSPVTEPSIGEIIEQARSQPAGRLGALVCTTLTTVLLVASFFPFNIAWLAWVALTPLIQLVRIERRTKSMYKLVYLNGVLWSLIIFNWMRLGDAAMYPAWIAISFYLGFYFVGFVAISRVAVHRFGVPLVAAVPVVWAGLEYARAFIITGCPWYFLGHSQFEWIYMIQVADLTGAYGVSFLLAMSAACVAGFIPIEWLSKLRLFPPVKLPADYAHLPSQEIALPTSRAEFKRPWLNLGVVLGIVAACFIYGVIRKHTVEFDEGPRVALIQGNFKSTVKHDPNEFQRIYRVHEVLTGMSVQHQPDLIVWPETMFRWGLRVRRAGVSDAALVAMAPPIRNFNQAKWVDSFSDPVVEDALHSLAEKTGSALIIGLDSVEARPEGLKKYNSAAFVTKQNGLMGRYDKRHRVLFGEYVPLKKTMPWLHKLTPFPEGFGIDEGDGAKVFTLNDWNLAPVICFEDTVPHLCREIVANAENGVDVFVNITNDGWFAGSAEQEQHLAIAVFRAIENRTPMVRAVNTGVSAIINGNGIVMEPDVMIDGDGKSQDEQRSSMKDPATGRFYKNFNGALVANVPLDPRTSAYTRCGDLFGQGCCSAMAFFAFFGVIRRRKKQQE